MKTLFLFIAIISFSHVFGQTEAKKIDQISAVRDLSIGLSTRKLAVAVEKNIFIFDLTDYRKIQTISTTEKPRKIALTKKEHLIVLYRAKATLLNLLKSEAQADTIFTGEALEDMHYDAAASTLYLIQFSGKVLIYKENKSSIFEFIRSITPPTRITRIATSDNKIAMGLQNGDILMFDKGNMHELPTLRGHAAAIDLLSFSENGETIASSASRAHEKKSPHEEEVILWSLKDQKIKFHTEDRYPEVTDIRIADNKEVIVSSATEIVRHDLSGKPSNQISIYPYKFPLFVLTKGKLIYGIADANHPSEYLYVMDLRTMKIEKNLRINMED
jgi:WD40 repeat protein